MLVFFKKHYFVVLFFIIITGCQFKEPAKNHGILYLENRSNQLTVNKDNKNDVLKLFGSPHTKSINNLNEWIYIERVLSKGEFHKLGQNILKTNNILVLSFDKYGILDKKNFLDKDDINKVRFSKKYTENNLAETSFVESFLNSIRSKMYSNQK
ncbi:MAG: outer membrane protein assembly factor BamE [Candidatus Pelagibacter bacterium]|nr:outer membrane protein assembly factor BamE [Candidatus Pelagibacter bacterium]